MSSLFECTSVDAVEAWANAQLEECIKSLTQGSKNDRIEFGKNLGEIKKMLHPGTTDPGVKDLLLEYHTVELDVEAKKELGIRIINAQKLINDGPVAKKYNSVFGKIERLYSEVCKIDMGSGLSNRAKRAKTAGQLFTKYAGFLRPEGESVEVDEHGNVIGEEFELGRVGAFDGLKIVILREYNGFSMDQVLRALKRKGFRVNLIDYTPSAFELERTLRDANQFWLIGTAYEVIENEHIEVIVKHWKDGMGMYVFGDNEPFYVDTNRLLTAMGLPTMMHDYEACKYLTPFDKATGKGFKTHLVTTGISERLYEGETIAEFDPDEVEATACEPIMYNSRGGISVIARSPKDGCGQVICDGAFTKLWCKWDLAGSDRFVRNCASYLAADLGEAQSELDMEEKEEAKRKGMDFNYDGCHVGECDVTFEEEPMSVMSIGLADVEQNTSDYVIDDPMSHARNNMVFGHQSYGVKTALEMLNAGMDPFRRTPALAVIPCVNLKDKKNFKLVTELLCNIFMAGKHMPKVAWLIFYSVCDEMIIRDNNCEHPDVWDYFQDQILENVKSTVDFSDMGEHVPLLRAFEFYASATDEIAQLRKSFSTTCLIARTLKNKSDVPSEQLISWIRHALIKVIVASVVTIGKANQRGTSDRTKPWFNKKFDNKFYDMVHGIPLDDSARVLPFKQALGWFIPFKPVVEALERVYKVFEIEQSDILTNENITALLSMFRDDYQERELIKYNLEDFVSKLISTNKNFATIWEGGNVEPISLLNRRFDNYFHASGPWAGRETIPPFVTPFGPSLFVATDGVTKFGDWNHEITEEVAEKVKTTRCEFLKRVYGSADINGYPIGTIPLGSSHYNLHRAIQRVMVKEEYKNDTEVNDDQVKMVCEYLLKDGKGYFYFRGIDNVINATIESYLKCRRMGLMEPGKNEPIKFFGRLVAEREARIAGLVDDTALMIKSPCEPEKKVSKTGQ